MYTDPKTGKFVKGNPGKPSGAISNKKLVGKLKSSISNAIKEFLKEEQELASQLSLTLGVEDGDLNPGVYIINAVGTNNYRIGSSSNVESRILSHKHNNHEEISVTCVVSTQTIKEANLIEKSLHNKFKDLLSSNSWYKMNREEVLTAIEYAFSINY